MINDHRVASLYQTAKGITFESFKSIGQMPK